MVAIKPTRDFTNLYRVSYAGGKSVQPKPNTATNLYRKEAEKGDLFLVKAKQRQQSTNTRKIFAL